MNSHALARLVVSVLVSVCASVTPVRAHASDDANVEPDATTVMLLELRLSESQADAMHGVLNAMQQDAVAAIAKATRRQKPDMERRIKRAAKRAFDRYDSEVAEILTAVQLESWPRLKDHLLAVITEPEGPDRVNYRTRESPAPTTGGCTFCL